MTGMRSAALFLLVTVSALLTCAQSLQDAMDRCDYIPQKQANIWYFYQTAGIDFNHNPPVSLSTNNTLYNEIRTAVSVLCDDKTGKLLLFSNGEKVWNRYHSELNTELAGSKDCVQASIIAPNPGAPSQLCYLFTVDLIHFQNQEFSTKGLRYSVVNIGSDIVTSPNNPLIPVTSEKLTGIRHSNGVDFWIVAHGFDLSAEDAAIGDVSNINDVPDANCFYAYHISGSGVTGSPITSNVGADHKGYSIYNHTGYMKISPDGSMIAVAIYGQSKIELFDFNATTGKVGENLHYSADVSSIPELQDAFCVEFSPDASRLYVSTMPLNNLGTSRILQFDLTTDPLKGPIILADSKLYWGLQLAPDGKIYISYTPKMDPALYKNLCVIENPNRKGQDCNFREGMTGLPLVNGESYRSLVNVIQSFVDTPHFTWQKQCVNDTRTEGFNIPTEFKITNRSNIDQCRWDFGDGNVETGGTEILHTYEAPGIYNVQVWESYQGQEFGPYSEQVVIYDLPKPDLGVTIDSDTIYKYPGQSIELYAKDDGPFYYWDGNKAYSGDEILTGVMDTGWRYVEVVDEHCCYNIDSVWIGESDVSIPNAFSPNGDNQNDTFKPIILAQISSEGYSMSIYDRWGKLIFSTNDYLKGWDGKIDGKEPAPVGVYIYIINYQIGVGDNKMRIGPLMKHVTLLR